MSGATRAPPAPLPPPYRDWNQLADWEKSAGYLARGLLVLIPVMFCVKVPNYVKHKHISVRADLGWRGDRPVWNVHNKCAMPLLCCCSTLPQQRCFGIFYEILFSPFNSQKSAGFTFIIPHFLAAERETIWWTAQQIQQKYSSTTFSGLIYRFIDMK